MTATGRKEPDHTMRHVVVGARGGQGTTTVAVALAALNARRRPTTLIAEDRDAARGMLGLVEAPDGPLEVAPGLTLADRTGDGGDVVVDAGPLPDLEPPPGPASAPVAERRWLVVRGPCYLALRTAVAHPCQPDGVVVVAEPRRALSAEDAARVLDVPVVAEVPQDYQVARAVDAGTLATRITRYAALAPLGQLLDTGPDVSVEALDPAARTAAARMSRHLDALQHRGHPSNGIDPLHR